MLRPLRAINRAKGLKVNIFSFMLDSNFIVSMLVFIARLLYYIVQVLLLCDQCIVARDCLRGQRLKTCDGALTDTTSFSPF